MSRWFETCLAWSATEHTGYWMQWLSEITSHCLPKLPVSGICVKCPRKTVPNSGSKNLIYFNRNCISTISKPTSFISKCYTCIHMYSVTVMFFICTAINKYFFFLNKKISPSKSKTLFFLITHGSYLQLSAFAELKGAWSSLQRTESNTAAGQRWDVAELVSTNGHILIGPCDDASSWQAVRALTGSAVKLVRYPRVTLPWAFVDGEALRSWRHETYPDIGNVKCLSCNTGTKHMIMSANWTKAMNTFPPKSSNAGASGFTFSFKIKWLFNSFKGLLYKLKFLR